MTIQQLKIDNRLQLPAMVVTVVLMLALPFFVHSIGGPTAGARWLPLFYAPLVAAILFQPRVALVASLVTPFLNHLLTGAPPLSMAFLLSFELVIFSFVAQDLSRRWPSIWAMAPLAYVVAKIAELLLLVAFPFSLAPAPPWLFVSSSLINAWPGLLVLLVINLLTAKGTGYGS